jgi:hypothetical protein
MYQIQPDPEIQDDQLQIMRDLYEDWRNAKYELQELQVLTSSFGSLLKIEGLPILLTATCILQSVTMAICRMTDEAKLGKFENVSLDQLRPLQADARLSSISSYIYRAQRSAGVFRDIRNKLLAHRDLDSRQVYNKNLLYTIDPDELSSCLDNIYEVHRYLSLQLWQTDLVNSVGVMGGMNSLVIKLAYGHRYQLQKEEAGDMATRIYDREYLDEVLF